MTLLAEHCTSRLVEARVPRVLRLQYLQSSPSARLSSSFLRSPFCPRICVCSTYWMALVASCGVLRMARMLSRPDRLAKMRFRRFLRLLQWRRMWATVCRLAPQSQRGLLTSGTLRAKRKSLKPIFSVRSCTSSALSRLVSPSWSRSTFLVGVN
ncbi:uncharacterized protein M421DRAFT_327630 [Didymella exigua CBS 183.55]|uniref:Uncharacterized protein n=1 Tax=Didymella exigua CBS 183.55 TaxID=1150837 RepID=A0A6A5R572_9PLEO|nr:uncharacterized protein M421DRAFT_327630 [Didymella exigua CBS 183.55]KAF1923271.1 hypothetical protein M421DRAFT_327630 [Didymella exigua CBS 183.55]